MKSLLTLLQNILYEIGSECSVDTTRDYSTIASRVEDEGLSFLTITLPSLGKGLEKALSIGQCAPDMFPSFGFHASLPRLCGGFFELIFDRSTGVILDSPSIPAIRGLRQLTLMWNKILVDCTDKRVANAITRFVECDIELAQLPHVLSQKDLVDFKRLSRLALGDMFQQVDRKIAEFDMQPKHGPGATADRVVANSKYEFRSWSERLDNVFPYWRYATSRPYSTEVLEGVQFYEPGAEPPVRVISVPKTLKTPRIIALEPTHMQFMQQAVLRAFTESSAQDSFLSATISTVSQVPNQELARRGSSDGSLATLDLSEASDRVSNWLVEEMLVPWPHLKDAVSGTRSTSASVDGFGTIVLAKYASMGSALCFPIEMYVFLTLCLLGIERANNTRFSSKAQLMRMVGKVRVYGDDIIVPVDTAVSVSTTLELFGFKVNASKSFWTGKFRESCGAEFYDGHDVSLARVRREFPRSRKDTDQLVSAVDLRNQLYKRGYWKTVGWLDGFISNLIPFPAVADTSSVLGKLSFLGYEEHRVCPKLQRPMVKGVVVKHVPRASRLDGHAALMKFFLKEGKDPIFSPDHLLFAGRPVSSNTKYGWAYSY